MRAGSNWPLHLALLAVATGAVVVACRNDVPGPTLPLPAPEVSPLGPRPTPIEPAPLRVDTDAGVPLPSPAEPSAARQAQRLRVAEAAHDVPVDAGSELTDAFDLPPVPDAEIEIVRDAAQPLR